VVPREVVEGALGSVRVRWVDASTGEPIEGRAGLSHVQRGGAGLPIPEDGRMVFERQLPGWLELDVLAEGFEYLKRFVEVRPGADVDLGTIGLRPALPLSGTVVDAQGRPVSTSVTWYSFDHAASRRDAEWRTFTRSDVEGAFELHRSGPGRNVVLAGGRDGLARRAVLVDSRTNANRDVHLVLPPGTPVAIRPAGPARLTVVERGLVLDTAYLRVATPWRLLLAPGRYTLEIEDTAGTRLETLDVGTEPLAHRAGDGS
jgi:hypothetical protein